jgi:hypothetical protein
VNAIIIKFILYKCNILLQIVMERFSLYMLYNSNFEAIYKYCNGLKLWHSVLCPLLLLMVRPILITNCYSTPRIPSFCIRYYLYNSLNYLYAAYLFSKTQYSCSINWSTYRSVVDVIGKWCAGFTILVPHLSVVRQREYQPVLLRFLLMSFNT